MQTVVFVPLAHDIEDGTISKNAQMRVRAALFAAWEANRASDVQAVLAFGAGAIPGKGSKTLAQYTQDYCNRARADLPMLTNTHRPDVFSTQGEMQWVIDVAYEVYNQNIRFVFVSQRRHVTRIGLIRKLFFSSYENIDSIISDQTEEISLFHEFLSYGKLFVVKMGLGGFARRVRRLWVRCTYKEK